MPPAPPAAKSPAAVAPQDDAKSLFWIFIWLGGLHVVIITAVVALLCLPHPGAVTVLCGLALASWWPVARPFTAWQTALAVHIARIANLYFPVTLQVSPATRKACGQGVKMVVGASVPLPDSRTQLRALTAARNHACAGLEPHSVLPISVIAFHPGMSPWSGLPIEMDRPNRCALASSAIFRVPLVKHLWSWLGLQSVDKRNMRCVLAP